MPIATASASNPESATLQPEGLAWVGSGANVTSSPALSSCCYRFAADTPIVGVHLIDHHHGGGRVLAQQIDQQLRGAANQCCFLLGAGAFARDLDVDIRHDV